MRGSRSLRLAGVVAALFGVAAAGMGAASGPPAPAASLSIAPAWTAPDATSAAVLAAAVKHLGDPYVYGGTGPTSWDCSGLTSTLWHTVGGAAGIPRTAADQQGWAKPVTAAGLLPGDLVFFDRPATHVAFALGHGWILDAAASRKGVVERQIWPGAVLSYGRVPRPGMPTTGLATTAPTTSPRPVTGVEATSGSRRPGAPTTAAATVPAYGTLSPASPNRAVRHFASIVWRQTGARYKSGGLGPAYDDLGLVHVAWLAAAGESLPTTDAGLVRRMQPVQLADLRIGDLVVYGAPYNHVGVYVGGGLMVDASRTHGVVMRRPVFAAPIVSFGRLG